MTGKSPHRHRHFIKKNKIYDNQLIFNKIKLHQKGHHERIDLGL